MKKTKLSAARQSIDNVDREIAKLINKRAQFAIEVGKAKGNATAAIYVPSREKEVMKNVFSAGKAF